MRHFTRRTGLALLACSTFFVASAGWAQTAWPHRPVKIVVPFAPGGTTDLLARAMAFTDPVTGQPRRFESRLQLAWP